MWLSEAQWAALGRCTLRTRPGRDASPPITTKLAVTYAAAGALAAVILVDLIDSGAWSPSRLAVDGRGSKSSSRLDAGQIIRLVSSRLWADTLRA